MIQPQVLTLNLDNKVVAVLKSKGYNIYEGSQGYQTKLDISYNSHVDCLTLHRFPANIHEFDMIILDQTNDQIIDYKASDHKITRNKTTKEYGIRCNYPQSLFDPRPLSLTILGSSIAQLIEKPFLLVTFCAQQETVEYAATESSYRVEEEKYSNYDFCCIHRTIKINMAKKLRLRTAIMNCLLFLKSTMKNSVTI